MESYSTLEKLNSAATSTVNIKKIQADCYAAMNDDFNTPVLLAHLFECARIINSAKDEKEKLNADDITLLKKIYKDFIVDILGLKREEDGGKSAVALDHVMQLLLDIRKKAKENKDYATSDLIRDQLNKSGIQVKDGKDGSEWSLN